MLSQAAILNKILQTKDLSIVSLNNLDAKYFFNYKNEFNFIQDHYDKYNVVPDKITFVNTFNDFEVFEVSEPDSYLLEQLYRDYNTSYLSSQFNRVKKLIESGKDADALQLYLQGVDGLHTGETITCTDLFEDTSRYDHYLERTRNKMKYYLTTSFPELDAVVGGIDRENENMVVIARTGVGKTQILLKMAAAASMAGLRVGIFEGEMAADKVGYRIDTYISHIKNTSMNRGDLYIQKEYKKYIDSLKSTNYGPIKVMTLEDIPSGDCTVNTLKTFIEKNNLDVLFVDQYDLMEDVNSFKKTEHEQVASIAKGVKKLQVLKKIPIISVCQMTRQKNEDGSKDTTQVAGSDKIPRYATIVLALEQKYDEANSKVEMEIETIKARDGGDHVKLRYFVDFNTGTFSYIPVEKDGVSTDKDLDEIEKSYAVEYNNTGNIF